MTNKYLERFATIQVTQPSGIAITSGNLYLLGRGTHIIVGVAAESQPSSGTVPYDSNTGYFTIDCDGAFLLSVHATTLGSVSAGAQIRPGDAVYADGGTYDVTTGITYGSTLSADNTGTFIGIALQGIAAGVTATIPVMLKSAVG